MSKKSLRLGIFGEETAARFLKGQGYAIVRRNYRTRLGEIDIIARDKDTLCFVEVKTRTSDNKGMPQESVIPAKKRQMAKAALAFLKEHDLFDAKARFDVVSVLYSDGVAKLELFKDAFALDGHFTY